MSASSKGVKVDPPHVIAGIGGASGAGASDLGPATEQNIGRVIAWDGTTDRLFPVEVEKGEQSRG